MENSHCFKLNIFSLREATQCFYEFKNISYLTTCLLFFQEADGQKTNNGIQYRLQLLYANGKFNLLKAVIHIFLYLASGLGFA